MAQLEVGDPAPAFRAKDHEGRDVSSDSLGGTRTVLYFFPKADTGG
jgi:peroxiredoxin Q/BCP